MEASRIASSHTRASGHPLQHSSETAHASAPPSKRHKPNVVAPSSPSKRKTDLERRCAGDRGLVSRDEEARRQASLLSYAEARARASYTYDPPELSSANEDAHRYPPAYSNGGGQDASARGMLEQIKNRMDARAPKPSNFLQKAKQVQQSLLDKQQRSADAQRARDEAARRESLRSGGFAEPHALTHNETDHALTQPSQPKGKPGAGGGAFSRAKPRQSESHPESDGDTEDDDGDYHEAAVVRRDDDLALVETLRPGPRPIPPNPNDPKWETMEPFSGHRLRERRLPHSQLKEHLRARYHIPPSLLYSIARPLSTDTRSKDWSRNGDYQVPVDGDWIVIATIVEKSELLVTKGFETDVPPSHTSQPASLRRKTLDEDDVVLFKDATSGANGKLRLDLEPGSSDAFQEAFSSSHPKARSKGAQGGEVNEVMECKREQLRLANRPRKFVVLKLVDLGVNSSCTGPMSGSGSADRGDNYLSLVAYESDQIETSLLPRSTNVRSEVASVLSSTSTGTKKWVNGSRGAFELLYQQAEGTLVAIMNPKVLRPFVSGARARVTDTKMLRLVPRSAEDCLVIGQAADYRRCSAIKANGQRCSNFVDLKARKQTQTTTCDYHLSRHMDQLARGRPEFAANATTRLGLSSGSGANASSGYGSTSAPVSKRHRGGYADEDSSINRIATTHSSSASAHTNAFSRAALARKLNSSFGAVGDGMDDNGGQVYVSQSPLNTEGVVGHEVRASNPSSWKYDVSGRYGRGVTEKQARLRKQIEEEQLLRKIEARFAPPPSVGVASSSRAARDQERGEGEECADFEEQGLAQGGSVLPVLPNGTAEMIHAAYSTLEQRKRLAQQNKDAIEAKRRKYTGIIPTSTSSTAKAKEEHVGGKLRFISTPPTARWASTTSSALSNPFVPRGKPRISSPSATTDRTDSRTALLSLATDNITRDGREVSLKLKRSHRPKMRLPPHEAAHPSTLTVVGGELIDLNHFNDHAWDALQWRHTRNTRRG